jgi:iron complex transport system substrate-binding protein
LTASQRIVSLLPSATEICFALGVGAGVAGVSHERDLSPEANSRPVLTGPKIHPDASPVRIERQVHALVGQGLRGYRIDEDSLRDLSADLTCPGRGLSRAPGARGSAFIPNDFEHTFHFGRDVLLPYARRAEE